MNYPLTVKYFSCIVFLLFTHIQINAQIVLLGENPPFENVNDGNFNSVWDYWRNAKQSPFWTTRIIKGDAPMGVHYGTLFSSNTEGIATSKLLNNTTYQQPKIGDIINWGFGADLEYDCQGFVSLSLVFGKHERILANKTPLKGGDNIVEHFKGTYLLTDKDVKAGLPFVKATFYSEKGVKIYLHYVNISVTAPEMAGPKNFITQVINQGIQLSWNDDKANKNSIFNIYRKSTHDKNKYQKIGKTAHFTFIDSTITHGINYNYLVTRINSKESAPSTIQTIRKTDTIAPLPPTYCKAISYDTEIKLTWTKSIANDIKAYSVYRSNPNTKTPKKIASGITTNFYEDLTPAKNIENTYHIYAHDHSGNKSKASQPIVVKTKSIFGASFKDLILPIPIHNKLSTTIWGAKNVIPRDPDNGIEHPDWSYWGGKPVLDKDNKYHMLVVRWPEKALKGHWEWPNSTVVHSISDTPTGPYLPTGEVAYTFANGLGHNADVIQLNNGSYLLYSLINWKPTLFTSKRMSGPWKKEGIMNIEYNAKALNDPNEYQVQRNLSGVQLANGNMLFITKFGRMIISKNGLLGPYKVVSDVIQKNKTIPARYRKSNYEDPTMWRDEVQFHCLINAFIDKRAIYLRSPDGIHWKFDPGIAYDTSITSYQDGTSTHWYKLERPHVLQDQYGRATHLSLAALDVAKKNDMANDSHNSKNLIVPLIVPKRIKLLKKEKITTNTKIIKLRILSEKGFDAQKDIDISSLRFGASEAVNFGKGSKVINTQNKGNDLIIEFSGQGNGITSTNFAGKLLGKTTKGDLLIGFCKLSTD